jgi:RNA polymerase sigma factor (sigma-70 family)
MIMGVLSAPPNQKMGQEAMITDSASDPVDTFVRTVRTEGEPSATQVQMVLELLRGWLARRGLSPEDLDEVSSDAVMRLLRVARDGSLDPKRPAGAWLRVVADHLAFDALRRQRRSAGLTLFEEAHVDLRQEDQLAAFVDRTAAAADVRRAMRAAAEAGEHDVVRVVSSWLALANADGGAPSTRQVAARLGISHMTVQRALQKFGRWLSS